MNEGERRAKNKQQEVTPRMMSDEEEADGIYIRQPPSFRSDLLNNFIAKLESCREKAPNKQPRKRRKDLAVSVTKCKKLDIKT